ncbi:hypothetical protein RB200_28710 [Streptomyces sp. PmtG]
MRTHIPVLAVRAAAVGCAALLLAGCVGSGSGGAEGGRKPGRCDERSGPDGRGAKGSGDLDRDGYDDYATAVEIRDASSTLVGSKVVVVHGSKGGLDTDRVRVYDDLGMVPGLRGDLDGDRFTDLVAQRNPDGPGKPVSVLVKGRAGCLGEPRPLRLPKDFAVGAVADVNGDDAADLIDPGHAPGQGSPGDRCATERWRTGRSARTARPPAPPVSTPPRAAAPSPATSTATASTTR